VDVSADADNAVADELTSALADSRAVHLSYYVPARDELTERDVDPMRMLVVDGRTYLEAWCRSAEDVRLFRLDRIEGLKVLDSPARVPVEAKARDLDAELFTPADSDVLVTLELDPAARWLADQFVGAQVEPAGDSASGRVVLRLRTRETAWVRRVVLRLGGAARIVAPESLAKEVNDAAMSALAAYRD
jgi:proteasome accessory factor C